MSAGVNSWSLRLIGFKIWIEELKNGSFAARNQILMFARKLAVRLSREADRDVLDILLYTRRTWGTKQRATYETLIVQALDTLSQHPQTGQPRDDLFPGCRSFQVEQHVIYYYQRKATEIVVRRILHYRQDASAAVEEPPA
jgi:toxin ParE1/3/4